MNRSPNKSVAQENQVLLLDLCNFSEQAAKPIFAVKMKGQKRHFPELELFRQQIIVESQGIHHLPYTMAKKQIMTYKSVFLALGLLFVFLGGMIIMKTASWHMAESYFLAAKGLICSFCAVAGGSALWIAGALRTEKEVSRRTLRQARYKLLKAHARKKMEFGLKGFFAFGKDYEKSLVLKHAYRDAQDRFHMHFHDLELLFHRIAMYHSLDASSREHLYNQAILEFSDKLDHTLEIFMQSKV